MSDIPLPRLATFAALVAAATFQWASLLGEPETWRFVLVAAIPLAAIAALTAIASVSRGLRVIATAAIGLAAAVAGLIAVGIPAGEFLPGGWDRLAYSVEDGFERLSGSLEYPLDDRGGISSALLVATLPIGLAIAAVLGFRPGRRGSATASLCVLLALFALPATIRPTDAPLAWGAVVLALICVWMWPQRVRAPAAIVLLACAGALAFPVASSLAQKDAVVDYTDWGLETATEEGVDFGWDHGYGPIDWSRTGESMFEVSSDEPRYWRATVLDEFYAFGWRRSAGGGQPVPQPTAASLNRWTSEASFSVKALESPKLISAGRAIQVDGIDDFQAELDGTASLGAEQLEQGTDYSVTAYAPEPGAGRMRLASRDYPEDLLPYTRVVIPFISAPLGTSQAIQPLTPATFQVPLWGSPGSKNMLAEGISGSPYGRMAKLARRLTAGEPNAYAAALAVQEHLKGNYTYSERPPARDLPLLAFLFRDRIGYCQQFSGAMALMLRMSGIPSRVATGFTPGAPVGARENTYDVTDLDAHSWVEVYFNGIGWVPFDPTPSAAPAESQSDGSGAGSAAPGGGGISAKDLEAEFGGAGGAGVGAAAAESSIPRTVLLVLLTLAILAALAVMARSFAFRRLPADLAGEAELAELAPALRASGRGAATSLTLLELERRLRDGGTRAGADYAGTLRDARFGGNGGAAPGLGERRAVRRELARRGGPIRYLRLLAAMPPGAPRIPRRRVAGRGW